MPVNTLAGGHKATHVLLLLALIAGVLVVVGLTDAFAQNPFGAPRAPAAPPPPDGPVAWILAKQAEFSLAAHGNMLRSAKTDGSAVWGLLGLSFLYGIFHAAGPGHGKAVISAYLLANDETWRRGVVLSFASALLQAAVAVAFVVIASWVFQATMATMCTSERYIEIVSYALIALLGLRLVWVKGRAFLNTARGMGRPLHAVGAAATPPTTAHVITGTTSPRPSCMTIAT